MVSIEDWYTSIVAGKHANHLSKNKQFKYIGSNDPSTHTLQCSHLHVFQLQLKCTSLWLIRRPILLHNTFAKHKTWNWPWSHGLIWIFQTIKPQLNFSILIYWAYILYIHPVHTTCTYGIIVFVSRVRRS